MTASSNGLPDRYGECSTCDSPDGEIICQACADDEWVLKMRNWLERQKTVAPGLTDVEVTIVERLIADLDASSLATS